PTASTATTYWSFGSFLWSWTCTRRSFRFSSFSSFRVAPTLPTTLPISIRARAPRSRRPLRLASSPALSPIASRHLEGRDDGVLRERVVEELLPHLPVHLRGHRIPRRRRA